MALKEEIGFALAALAQYAQADRLYTLEWAESSPFSGDLVVERWQGVEALSNGFAWQVDALSVDAQLPLDDRLGQRVTLWTRLADGSLSGRTGLVREAECVGSDGSLARYRLTLVPWTWLMSQSRHSRVYQDKTVLQIVAAVFAGYAPFAAWRWQDDVGPFMAQVRPRSFVCQYRESDEDFIQRLLAEEGLGWRLEEAGDAPKEVPLVDAAGGMRVVLFADSSQVQQDTSSAAGGGLRFHRSDGTESSDSIQAFGAVHRLQSTALTLLSTDYKSMQAQTVTVPLGDSHHPAQPVPLPDTAAHLEIYDPVGVYAFADRNEAERTAGLIAQARQSQATQWFGFGSVRTFRAGSWFALTNAPLGSDGPTEALVVAVHQAGVNNLPRAVRVGVVHALGQADAAPMHGVGATAWRTVLARAEAVGYGNHFSAVPRGQPWRPVLADETGARINPRPTAPGYQTAIVVGPDATTRVQGSNELHSDALGRIRVQFHFQHDAQHDAAADAAQQVPSRDSCWLRVAQRYAGPGVGSQFLPRIGQEVLVGFLDGDIDRPMVMGALYNGQGEGLCPAGTARNRPERTAMEGRAGRSQAANSAPGIAGTGCKDLYAQATDHRPSAQANTVGGHAPAWHGMSPDGDGHRNAAALSGIKSKEFGGSGHNRLVFDDSDGQLRLQLATTHAASELNLGHLIHQADNYRGSFRGEGFELRTDQWGAVRAQRGLWISAYPIDGDAPAGDQVGALALLRQAEQLGKTFSDIAGVHQTVRLAAHQGTTKADQSQLIDGQAPLNALLTSAKALVSGKDYDTAQADASERESSAATGRVPHSADALLGLTAPAGIGFVAGQSLHWAVGETLTIASGQASNAAIAGDLRLQSGQAIGWLANAVESSQAGAAHALSLVTAEGKLEFQAQHDQVKLQSRDQLQIVSANAEVELAAGKTLHMATAGGASITIEGGNISIACPGTITVHAGKKSFVGPTSLDRQFVKWPESSLNAPCLQGAAEANAAFVKVPE